MILIHTYDSRVGEGRGEGERGRVKRETRYGQRGAPRAKFPGLFSPDSADPRERILAIARSLFAEFGFNATSIRDITKAADVNLGAVGYYFTTKEMLYLNILRSIVGPLSKQIERCMAGDEVPPLERIERAVRTLFIHIRANPDMPAFMMREMTTGLPPSEPIRTMLGRVLPAMAKVIAEGQARGEIRAGDPMLYVISVIAQPVHLYLARNAISMVTGINLEDAHDRIVDHAVAVVHGGLAAG